MATAYTQIYQYRDPEKLSISDTLGKAATYKQNLYDANTTAMQQLINQYAGIDLIKDIDKQYLGERLSTLTNYINQAGAMDWSRKSIFNDVSHYVGQALDTNVMNAISSTQALMKQNAEIEQKKKDGKYGVANEWLAKAGLEDYLKSNKVGDIYRPGQYFDYVDTDKKIMEALPKLKEFMIDVKWTSDGNPLLVSMEEHEVLTKEEASKYLDLALGEDGKRQLSINGLYNFRNTNEVTLKETYKSEINKNVEILNKKAKDLEIMAIGKPKEQKEKFLNYSKSLKDQASEYKNHEKNIDKLDKNTIASNIYLNEYKNKWADLLSYDKVTDWKIDDRNFRLAERNDKLSHQAWEEKFNEDKFLAEQDWKKKQYNLDMAKALSGDNPISVDENGNPIPNTGGNGSSSSQGITKTSNPTKTGENGGNVIMAEDVYQNYSDSYNDAIEKTKEFVDLLKSSDRGQELLRKHYGNISESKDVQKLVWAMMRGDKASQLKLQAVSKGFNIPNADGTESVGQKALRAINNSISAYRQRESLNGDLVKAQEGIANQIPKILKADVKGGIYGFSGKIIDGNGKLIDGTYLGSNYNNLTDQQKIATQIGYISNRLFAGKIPDEERSALTVLRKRLIAKLKDPKAQEYYNEFDAQDKTSLWDSVTSSFSGIGQSVRAAWNLGMIGIFGHNEQRIGANGEKYTARVGESEDVRAYEDASKTANANFNNAKRIFDRGKQHIGDMFNINYTINDWTSDDLKDKNGKIISFGKDEKGYNISADEAYSKEVGTNFKSLQNKLNNKDKFRLANSTVNLNMEIKDINQQYGSWVKAVLPFEMEKDGNVKIDVDKDTGNYTISAIPKGEKEYSDPITIKPSDIPQNLLKQIKTDDDFYWNASNEQSNTFYTRGKIYKSENEINDENGDFEINPLQNRHTYDSIIDRIEMVIGTENLNKHKSEIQKIITTPVDIDVTPINGVYVTNVKSGNVLLGKQIVGQNLSEEIRDNISNQSDKIAADKIVDFVTKVYNK